MISDALCGFSYCAEAKPGQEDNKLYKKEILSLEDVKRVAAAAEAEARRNIWNVVIAIVDDG